LLNNIVEQTGRGGHNRVDYNLTVNTAKKISMAEQTTKGNKAIFCGGKVFGVG